MCVCLQKVIEESFVWNVCGNKSVKDGSAGIKKNENCKESCDSLDAWKIWEGNKCNDEAHIFGSRWNVGLRGSIRIFSSWLHTSMRDAAGFWVVISYHELRLITEESLSVRKTFDPGLCWTSHSIFFNRVGDISTGTGTIWYSRQVFRSLMT